MAPLAMPSSRRMMAISVVMRSSTLLRWINTLNYRLKMLFEETFCGQETGKFRPDGDAGARRRADRRHLADRANRECIRICGLAFRFGVRPLAARLPRRHAGQR